MRLELLIERFNACENDPTARIFRERALRAEPDMELDRLAGDKGIVSLPVNDLEAELLIEDEGLIHVGGGKYGNGTGESGEYDQERLKTSECIPSPSTTRN